MSDYIYVSLEIGGTLPASLVPEFLQSIDEDIINKGEEITLNSLKGLNDSLKINGEANYGLCTHTKEFCMEHGLSFINQAEAKCDYNADATYFVPGMEDVDSYNTDQNGNAVVRLDQVKPLIELLLELAEHGDKALPKFLNNPAVADLVKDCLDSPADIIKNIKERLSEVLPQEAPDIPPLIIDETK